jgi:hypothetical protein
MLREVKSARFVRRPGLLGDRFALALRGDREVVLRRRALAVARADAATVPVALAEDDERTWWLFEDRVFWEDEGLEARDVLALVRERERRDRRRLERAHAALALDDGVRGPRRTAIPAEVRQAVFERSGGRCVACGATFDLQYDHVIPLALGGASTVENLQVLCAPCNRAKGAALG